MEKELIGNLIIDVKARILLLKQERDLATLELLKSHIESAIITVKRLNHDQ